MRIILTGTTGFIGGKLLNILKLQNHEIMVLGRNPDLAQSTGYEKYAQYSMGDELPREIFNFSPEILIHLAWEGIPDFSAEMCLKNVSDQIKFIQDIKTVSSIKKVIVSGSCVEYGNKTGICHESERNSPNSYFSWSKQTLCDFYKLFCQENNIKLIWFRLFYVYGPGQRPESLIPTLLKSFGNNQAPALRNPAMANDYIHVNDVIDGFIAGVENKEIQGIYNLGSGELTPVYQISSIIEELVCKTNKFSSKLISEPIKRASLNGFYADITSAQLQLGWKPEWDIKRGIGITYKDLQEA